MGFSKNKKEIAVTRITDYSDMCDVAGCNNDTMLVITQVRNEKGYLKNGAFSQFGDLDKKVLKDGYKFVRWITRCAECNQNDLIRAGIVKDVIPISHHLNASLEKEYQISKPRKEIGYTS